MVFADSFETSGFIRSGHPSGALFSAERAVSMKIERAAPSPQAGTSLNALEGNALAEARQANVPVVVLGATIGGLATAVAIRSRTGRAVCVIDMGGSESEKNGKEKNSYCVLSARSLDAVRAINADLHRALLTSIAEETAAGVAPKAAGGPAECLFDLPLRLSSALLRELLLFHLTAGAGGSSCLWRSSRIQHIACFSTPENEEGNEGGNGVVIVFENGVVIKAGLVVVAAEIFPLLTKTEDRMFVEGVVPLPNGVGAGLWFLRGAEDPKGVEVALLSETEKQTVTFVASSPYCAAAICPQSPGLNAATVSEKQITPQEENETQSAALLSAVLEEIKKTPASVRSKSIPKDLDSSWRFWGGRLILTGTAAHPWVSSIYNGLELDLEDAAQLGCSLYDWKFALRMASDRFQVIRKRRIASIIENPRLAKGSSPASPEGISGRSTVATTPEAFQEEDETFVPRRDAYAELLPAVRLGYEVQEAELY